MMKKMTKTHPRVISFLSGIVASILAGAFSTFFPPLGTFLQNESLFIGKHFSLGDFGVVGIYLLSLLLLSLLFFVGFIRTSWFDAGLEEARQKGRFYVSEFFSFALGSVAGYLLIVLILLVVLSAIHPSFL